MRFQTKKKRRSDIHQISVFFRAYTKAKIEF